MFVTPDLHKRRFLFVTCHSFYFYIYIFLRSPRAVFSDCRFPGWSMEDFGEGRMLHQLLHMRWTY
ncbi:hypothetical protein PHYPO_G00221780 [Pangasianodon hypophthalmus]|uniref:Uncharacterized protein n=1 Tax=Pangasianodon hypophthalmus TaxID=310915 RepID=A0A5N5NX63_PANHP|nr:hypothetical protein PHYPO_G00221780 [Pangasianodon hypophthalmus]